MDAGGDWSGKGDQDEVLVFGFAAAASAESWSEQCAAMRQRLGKPQRAEFHARDMNEHEILDYLQSARDAGIVMGAVILKKPPASTHPLTNFNCAFAAQEFFRVFLTRYNVRRFWYDTEIEGRVAEQGFETELSRINRELCPGTSLKARCRRSHQSDLVQIADSVAYAMRRRTLGVLKLQRLQRLIDEILADKRNVFLEWGKEGKSDLRPYSG